MADEANTQAAGESQQAAAEATAGDSATQKEDQATGNEAPNNGTQTTGDQFKQDANASTGDKSQSDQNKDSKQEFKPVSRRSAAHRIQQLARENAELRKNNEKSQQDSQDDQGDENAGDDPKPDINKLVAEAVQAALKPVMTEHTKTADDSEINEFFSGEKASQRAEYEPQIRKLWELPQYKDVAAQDLHAMLVGRNIDLVVSKAVEEALKQAKVAESEAKESSASGSSNISNRTGKDGKSVWDMSSEEFQKHNEQIKAKL